MLHQIGHYPNQRRFGSLVFFVCALEGDRPNHGGASVVAYIIGEGLVDAQGVAKTEVSVPPDVFGGTEEPVELDDVYKPPEVE